ncbi:ComEA family DNA-binding protein [Paenibacillus silvisoli]|uniref:ComEA family DNA-binding protein n=1 Tax=Paenibacillus silvisoli TaxID=3110539 RepID=UPI002803B8E2|nr:helix-hairpin-helix domain-containing protein [Paenibacillus silvisoli]
MHTKRTRLDRQSLLIGLLIVAAAVLAVAAVARTKAAAPDGWVQVNAQVEQAIKPFEHDEPDRSASEKPPASEAAPIVEKQTATALPAKEQKSQPTARTGSADAAGSGKIDINHATAAELDALPGIGAAKAKSIVDDREKNGPFRSADDLLRVKGIGPKLLDKMKSFIVVQQ